MEEILLYLAKYSVYAFAVVSITLGLFSLFILFLKVRIHHWYNKIEEFEKRTDELYQNISDLNFDISEKEFLEQNYKSYKTNYKSIKKKKVKLKREVKRFGFLVYSVDKILNSPIGKILLYIGNKDPRTGSQNERSEP